MDQQELTVTAEYQIEDPLWYKSYVTYFKAAVGTWSWYLFVDWYRVAVSRACLVLVSCLACFSIKSHFWLLHRLKHLVISRVHSPGGHYVAASGLFNSSDNSSIV